MTKEDYITHLSAIKSDIILLRNKLLEDHKAMHSWLMRYCAFLEENEYKEFMGKKVVVKTNTCSIECYFKGITYIEITEDDFRVYPILYKLKADGSKSARKYSYFDIPKMGQKDFKIEIV